MQRGIVVETQIPPEPRQDDLHGESLGSKTRLYENVQSFPARVLPPRTGLEGGPKPLFPSENDLN